VVGAILIVAGGPLTDKPCDSTATAQYIKQLRTAGVYTFVPTGNDGKADQVRFPACASDAIAVGALDRNGTISAVSNGSKTRMVSLYTDGDTLLLPIRSAPVPGLECIESDKFHETVKGYQKVLALLKYYSGEPNGELDPKSNSAVRQYQSKHAGLTPTGKFDAATLLTLDGEAKKLQESGSQLYITSAAANVRWAKFADLSDYMRRFCVDHKQDDFYQAQYVSGTLVSAAVASGQFLKLLDVYKSMSTDEAFRAVLHTAQASSVREFDLDTTMKYIGSPSYVKSQ
jgi:hypothetical protein